MLRLVRTIILVLLAFVAGLLVERYNAAERCTASGGAMQDGLCKEA
ncbi:MAG: hypothetical protein AAF665_02510 [Pseudomonadota bacterium]